MPAARQITTEGIVLKRVNYGEADRIVTFLTPDQGKVTAIAKGARKPKSKLAGGLEVFSVSEISFIKGKKDIDTLTSTRLKKHFGNVVKELARSDAAYSFIKLTDKATQDNPEAAYFHLLAEAFAALNTHQIKPELTQLWFDLQLLKTTGHSPNLTKDDKDEKLQAGKHYNFNFEQMRFVSKGDGDSFGANDIKFLRLALQAASPSILEKVNGGLEISQRLEPLAGSMVRLNLHV